MAQCYSCDNPALYEVRGLSDGRSVQYCDECAAWPRIAHLKAENAELKRQWQDGHEAHMQDLKLYEGALKREAELKRKMAFPREEWPRDDDFADASESFHNVPMSPPAPSDPLTQLCKDIEAQLVCKCGGELKARVDTTVGQGHHAVVTECQTCLHEAHGFYGAKDTDPLQKILRRAVVTITWWKRRDKSETYSRCQSCLKPMSPVRARASGGYCDECGYDKSETCEVKPAYDPLAKLGQGMWKRDKSECLNGCGGPQMQGGKRGFCAVCEAHYDACAHPNDPALVDKSETPADEDYCCPICVRWIPGNEGHTCASAPVADGVHRITTIEEADKLLGPGHGLPFDVSPPPVYVCPVPSKAAAIESEMRRPMPTAEQAKLAMIERWYVEKHADGKPLSKLADVPGVTTYTPWNPEEQA